MRDCVSLFRKMLKERETEKKKAKAAKRAKILAELQ
jgi:hypothetical protein